MLRPSLVLTNTVYPCTYREHTYALAVLPLLQRFIPVHTGNTQSPSNLYYRGSVYPCAYREHWVVCMHPMAGVGLSLCIQGTLISEDFLFLYLRFIPVHTGNTCAHIPIHWVGTVYPCAYREHSHHPINCPTDGGLSLCIQGTPISTINNNINARFIPVHTGNTI